MSADTFGRAWGFPWAGLLRPGLSLVHFVAGSRWRAGGRPLWQAALLTVLLAAVGVVLKPEMIGNATDVSLSNDSHASRSLEIAIHRVLWGVPSHCYVEPSSAVTTSMRLAQSDCRSQTVLSLSPTVSEPPAMARGHLAPFRNNENSLMLVDTALLRLWPGLTMDGLVRAHEWVKLACLAVFLLFLVRAGASLLFSFGLFFGALSIVVWINQSHPLSLYPLVLPCTLLLIACLGLALSFGLHRRPAVGTMALSLVGALAAFLANLRTTYLLVALALTLSAGMIAWLDLRRTALSGRYRLAATLLPASGFVAGFLLFTHTFIGPIQAATAQVEKNRTYHLVMHPLVLSLALPSSALSRREGIAWQDACGLTLAQRIDPRVQYKDAHYESALLLYYLKLWLYDAGEMRRLYAAKLALAGVDYFQHADTLPMHRDRLFALGLAEMRRVPSGGAWLALLTLLGLAGLVSYRYLGPAAAFSITALGAVGALMLLESAIILPYFYVQYQGTLLFGMLCTGLLVYQLPVDGALLALARVAPGQRLPGTADATSCRLCQHTPQRWFIKRGRTLCRCPGCGLITVPEGLARSADGRSIYEVDENIFHQDGNEAYYLDATNLWSCELKLKWIAKYLPAGTKLLDAGANFGHFLKVAQQKYDAVGFDLSPQAVRWSREHFGVQNHAGSIEAPPAAVQGPFDGITCWDVIEHVPDPEAALAALYRLLKPDGMLFLSTPDAGSLVARLLGKSWYYLDPIQHLNLFSRANLSRLLEQAEFEVLAYRSFGRYYRLRYVIDRVAQLYPSGPLGWLSRLAAWAAWPVRELSLYLKCGDVMGLVARRRP